MQNTAQLQGSQFPPQEHFITGVLIDEMAAATTWDRIMKIAEALHNVRQQAGVFRAEVMQRVAYRQTTQQFQNQSAAAVPTPPFVTHYGQQPAPMPSSYEPLPGEEIETRMPWEVEG